jgi:hypothetical protein
MATLDQERHELGLVVVVLGGANQKFLGALPLHDGELRLGAVHGFTPRLRFHSFSVDPWANDEAAALEKLLPHTDALVLTDAIRDGTHYSSAALERLVRSARHAHTVIPVAIFGGPALTQEWATLSASQPVFAGEPEAGNAAGALKALLKVLLKTISPDGTTSPPPNIH